MKKIINFFFFSIHHKNFSKIDGECNQTPLINTPILLLLKKKKNCIMKIWIKKNYVWPPKLNNNHFKLKVGLKNLKNK